MGARLRMTPPEDYLLKRDVCSYGYFHLAPNRWSVEKLVLSRVFSLPGGQASVEIAQPGDASGRPLAIRVDRSLDRTERSALRSQITRMLRLDDPGVAEFHRVDPRWRRSGRARIFRSPTFFEDVLKTVTSCNVTWAGTKSMNRRLCEVISPAFPAPEDLARRRPASLRSRCAVGYRDVRIVELAKLFAAGEVTAAWFEEAGQEDAAIRKALLALPGVGPYAASNLMQLLGRYGHLPIDTEAIRHGREILGFTGADRAVEKRLHAHYERFGGHRFRSFWFELWSETERSKGPAWTWSA